MAVIIGIGLDLVEVARIERAVARWGDAFLGRVFASGEVADCGGADRLRPDRLAARFCAKEAVFKALGRGRPDLGWQDVEVVKDAAGQPGIVLTGRALTLSQELGVTRVVVSLSHLPGLAAAQAICLGGSSQVEP